MLDARTACMQPTAPAGPVRVALDYYYEVHVPEEGFRGGLHGSPGGLEDAVTGLLLREGIAGPGDQAEIVAAERLGERHYRVTARLVRAAAARRPAPPREPVPWSLLEGLYRDFVHRVSKRLCPYAVHTLAAYSLAGDTAKPLLIVSDVSRHAAALKAAGMLSRLYASSSPLQGPLAVASTGRVSGDMVAALAQAGAVVIVANHHPVLSGVEEAARRGVVLVLRSPDGRGLAVYTAHRLVQGGTRVRLSPPGEAAGATLYHALPSPLC